jgi:hypothetical protein
MQCATNNKCYGMSAVPICNGNVKFSEIRHSAIGYDAEAIDYNQGSQIYLRNLSTINVFSNTWRNSSGFCQKIPS